MDEPDAEENEVKALLVGREDIEEVAADEVMEESEALDVLATWPNKPGGWKQARKEINNTKLGRKFGLKQSPHGRSEEAGAMLHMQDDRALL